MGHNRNLADYAHHFDGTNIDLGSGNIETDGVVTYEDVTNVDSVGIITARAGVKVPDSQNISLGTGNDFAITHDGTNTTFINDTGQIQIRNRADDQDIILQTDDGSGGVAVYLRCDGSSGQVDLNHYGSRKFYTSSTGATVNGTLVSDGVTSELDLSAISASISNTAVDVFVYDTSKDSDGGAWRKRTQHTSWYNETLNTSTRGSRKEFPSVAVIVAESNPNKVTIYDGDDPDLPMWMVFNASTNSTANFLTVAGQPLSSIFMLNGELGIGFPSANGWGLNRVNFLSDSQGWYWTSATIRKQVKNSIAERNDQNGYVDSGSGISGLANARVNDIVMTVLPNAPIDDATGLSVPTIALATAGGVSVIKDDGTVVDAVGNTFDDVNAISFDSSNRIICSSGTAGTDQAFFCTFDIPSSDTSNVFPGGENGYYRRGYSSTDLAWFGSPGSAGNHSINDVSKYRNGDIAFGTEDDGSTQNPGLKIISENITSPANGMLCGISTSLNTGWMHGDIKGAFLSDTDTTNLAPNDILGGKGTFDDASYWTAGPTWSVSGGVATATSGTNSYLTKNDILTTGARYTITLTVSSYSTGTLYVYCGTGAPGLQNHYFGISANGTYTMILDAYNTNFGLYNSSFTGVVDNLTISSVVDNDRSVNRKNLGVIGTVTRSAVATGAELVAYSNFSASNHLRQPYNSDMNIGTGDAYEMIWYQTTNSSGTMMMISYEGGATGTTNYGLPFNIRYENGSVRGWASPNGFTTFDDVNHGVSTADGKWHHAAWVKRGQVFELYVDGEFIGSDTGAVGSNTLSDANSELVIGGRKRGLAPGTCEEPWNNGYLALARIGKSAPTAEQIKKIYEDEKFLFQENAKATLYGSSDAVTALGYDEDTELLHVGTSAGRSDFQGLRRINNTTTAVTTAISASDELIVEQ